MKRLLILFLLLISCSAPSVSFDNIAFSVEIATNPDQKAEGLMFRESLPEDQGMLFIFDNVAPRSFWMKNTLIPLDMIFLDDSLTVVDIETAVPCKEKKCPSYGRGSAMYVLEINAGLAKKYGIVEGSKMVLSE